MAVINLTDRLVGSGSTDTFEVYGLRVGTGGLTTRNTKAPVFNLTRSVLNTAGDLAYTAAQLAGGVILRDPNGGARADSFDTTANIISTCGLSADGDSVICYVLNTADAAETITYTAGGAGVTIDNPQASKTLAQDKEMTLVITRTSSTAVAIALIGNG